MSGHLQRMAAGAARPERGVRPLVGNLFAKEQDVEHEVMEESTLLERPRPVAATAAEPHGVTERASVGREPVREEHAPPRKTEQERLVERVEVAGTDKPVMRGEAPMPGRETRERLVETCETVRPIETHPLLVQQSVVRDHRERVAMGADEAPEAEAVEGVVVQPPGERSAVERVSAQREQRPGQRPSEEIQIHIGRIEVIAVPAPQPRASAPAGGRRVESLEEYLRRRDRRTR